MHIFRFLGLLAFSLLLGAPLWAQNTVRIIYPQAGQDVRGEVTARFEGIPAGGYAIISLDGQFKQATAQEFVVFDTLADRATFTRGDGSYKLDIVVRNPGGGVVGSDSVTFNVANSKIAEGAESVRLSHWVPGDIFQQEVVRYGIFAESTATISGGMEAGGAGGAGGGGGGAAGGAGEGGEMYIPAPLDWQISALMRRMMRNYPMWDGSANIATTVQDAYERQRLSEAGGQGAEAVAPKPEGGRRKKKAPSAPTKAPWNDDWVQADETGKFFVEMIKQDGTEINATRKAPTIALADLLPTFPNAPVRPGSTWETSMTILGDLSSRKGVNVLAPMTFTAYETLVTPAGESRRAAKLESRFRLPDDVAKRIAANLANSAGSAAGGGAGGMGGMAPAIGGAETEETGFLPEDFEVARTNVARVIWFDMDRRRVLRAEDSINSFLEVPVLETEMGGAPGGGAAGGGGEAVAMEPTKISYNLRVTTWIKDEVPDPTEFYNGGAGTAHSRDSVTEPDLAPLRAVKNR